MIYVSLSVLHIIYIPQWFHDLPNRSIQKTKEERFFFSWAYPKFPFVFPSLFFLLDIILQEENKTLISKTTSKLIVMGNCLVGKKIANVTEEEDRCEEVIAKKDYKGKDRKVKIVITRDELEKLILFQLNADGAAKGGDATLASFGDFLRELEAERVAGEAAAAAAEEEKSRQRLCRRWRPSLESVIEWPEEV